MTRHSVIALLSTFVLVPIIAFAQSFSPKKDIPTIAKSASGAIVTIVMAHDDKPIARGTGFLVGSDGAIATNYHVIATGNVAAVKFADGTMLPVDGALAIDKVRDLAIIKIHGKAFPSLTLGNSEQIQVGDEVVAIGNPLGLELTVSNGILSGIRSNEKHDYKLLQITAPISPGSSGGPLFNMAGEVIGITTMYLKGGENLNFAIPVNDAKRLLVADHSELKALPNEQVPLESDGDGTSAQGQWVLQSYDADKGYTFVRDGVQYQAECWATGRPYLGFPSENIPDTDPDALPPEPARQQTECADILPYLHKPVPNFRQVYGSHLLFTDVNDGRPSGNHWKLDFVIRRSQ
jgi:S1-C subfamily serine protease